MFGSHGNEIAVVDIIECRSGITVDGCSIGVGLVAVRRHITTSEHGIVDLDAPLTLIIGVTGEEFLPTTGIGAVVILLRQGVQVIGLHIVIHCVSMTIDGRARRILHLQIGRDEYLTVLGQVTCIIIIIDVSG